MKHRFPAAGLMVLSLCLVWPQSAASQTATPESGLPASPESASPAAPPQTPAPAPDSAPSDNLEGKDPWVSISRLYWALVNNDLQKIWRETRTPEAANTPLGYGGSPLTVAAAAGHLDAVKLLLTAGAKPEQAMDDQGIPLLTRLYLDGQTALLRYFLEKGVPWTVSPVTGASGLHILALWPEPKAAEYYEGWGFDPLAADYLGRTPLMLAARAGNLVMVQYFLSRGADPSDTDILGRTALDLARQAKSPEVVQALEAATVK